MSLRRLGGALGLILLVPVLTGCFLIQASPNPGGDNRLFGVSCPAVGSCTAVGEYIKSGSVTQTLIETGGVDGTTWSVVPSPDPSNQSVPINELSGVSCISTVSCTAVGDYITNTGSRKALIESWDGTAWSVVLSPNASPIGLERLTSISCVSISSCTAVGGAFNNGSVLQTLVETFDGTTWSVVPSPDGSSSDTNFLNGVSCPPASSGTCTAVGLFSADTLIIHDVPIS